LSIIVAFFEKTDIIEGKKATACKITLLKEAAMGNEKIYQMAFSKVFPLLIAKAEKPYARRG